MYHRNVVLSYIVWLSATRTAKLLPHLWNNPGHIVYVPAFIAFGYYFAIMKIYALLTLHEVSFQFRCASFTKCRCLMNVRLSLDWLGYPCGYWRCDGSSCSPGCSGCKASCGDWDRWGCGDEREVWIAGDVQQRLCIRRWATVRSRSSVVWPEPRLCAVVHLYPRLADSCWPFIVEPLALVLSPLPLFALFLCFLNPVLQVVTIPEHPSSPPITYFHRPSLYHDLSSSRIRNVLYHPFTVHVLNLCNRLHTSIRPPSSHSIRFLHLASYSRCRSSLSASLFPAVR